MHTICRSRDCPLCDHYLLTVFRWDGKKTVLMQMTSKSIPKLIAEGSRWWDDETKTYYQIRPE